MNRSTAWLIGAVFGVLIAALVWGVFHYRDAMDRAHRAADQAQEVRALADQITALTDQPTLAVTETDEVQQLSGLIEASAAGSGIEPHQIASINAQDARRVGQSPYYRLPTRVQLDGVVLTRLVDLLGRLTEGGRIRVDDCRVAAPHGEIVGQTWNAEFTLSYLVYDPRQDTAER